MFMKKSRGKLSRLIISFWFIALKVQLFDQAAALAYITLLSIVPTLGICFIGLAKLTTIFESQGALLVAAKNFILANLTLGAGETALLQLEKILTGITLEKIGLFSAIGMLFTQGILFHKIEEAFNRVWENEGRKFSILNVLRFCLFFFLGVIVVALVLALPSLAVYASFGSQYLDATQFITKVLAFSVSPALFTIFYRYIPQKPISWSAAFISAVLSSMLLALGSKIFHWYISDFSGFDLLYGALGVVPAFLVWLYVLWVIIITGAIASRVWLSQYQEVYFDSKNA